MTVLSLVRLLDVPMITEIAISNFRSFSQAALKDCRRINLIVGDNGSGKTALLEAAFLAAGSSPEIALRARAWRGFQGGKFEGTEREVGRSLWADLFHNFQTKKPAYIALAGQKQTKEHTRSLTISYDEDDAARHFAQTSNLSSLESLVQGESPITFLWKAPNGFKFSSKPFVYGGEIRIPPGPKSLIETTFFAANHTYSANEVSNRFSELSKHFQEREFVNLFGKHFKNITDLSIEVSAGSPMVFAKVEKIKEKIPVSLASGGMNKLIAILLAFSFQPGGVVFLDEIESGFYYKRFPLVWESILSLARNYNVQLFVTTHSAECLAAAAVLAESEPQDFCMFRTALVDGVTRIRRISGEKVVAARHEEIEIR
jgi:ABC-type lipoprotein export system ATPase subunit